MMYPYVSYRLELITSNGDIEYIYKFYLNVYEQFIYKCIKSVCTYSIGYTNNNTH